MSEPVAAEIDWTPEGVTVIYAVETEWWNEKVAVRLERYGATK